MNLLKAGSDLVGDLGFKVIKNSGRVVWGGGQMILGAVSDNDELVEKGLKNTGKGALGLGIGLLGKNKDDDDLESDCEGIDI